MLMNKLPQCTIVTFSFERNECLIELAPLTKEFLNTRNIPEDRRIQLSRAFEDIKSINLINPFDYVIYLLVN